MRKLFSIYEALDKPRQGIRRVKMTLFEELYKAAESVEGGFSPQKPGQSDEDYLISLVRTISGVADDVWVNLSSAAQSWYNRAAEAGNAMKPLPVLAGYKGTGQVEAPVKPKEPMKKGRRSSGVISAIYKTTLTHPDWNAKQIHQDLVNGGWTTARIETVTVTVGDIRRMVGQAKELGLWNDARYEQQKSDEKKEPVSAA